MTVRHVFSAQPLAALALAGLLPLAHAASPAKPAAAAPLPTLLRCAPDDLNAASVSLDASGTPLQASLYLASGTHECGLVTDGPATAQPDGAFRFDWNDRDAHQRYRLTVRRAGDAYTLSVDPRRCGTLELPATVTVAPKAKGCKVAVDRDFAFTQFWRELRDAVKRRDGEQLQRLSLPQLQFAEGSDVMTAPAAILRGGAGCVDDVVAATSGRKLGQMLQANETPRLDSPPWSRQGDARVSVDDAITVAWTKAGWRLEYFNASRDVFSKCKAR